MLLSQAQTGPTHTLPCELRDYPQWHRGRQRYAVWSIPVDCPAVLARMQAARELLGDWLHPADQRQAHITLFVCGFIASQRQHSDDFTAPQLERQSQALAQLRPRAFSLQIGGLDSFASAAFLQVTDARQQLPLLRRQLAGATREIRQAPYHPHLTLGLYRQRIAAAAWRERATALAELPPLPLAVKELHYCSYQAQQLFGPLRVERRLPLAD